MAPAALLPVKTVRLELWRVIRNDFLLLTILILSVGDIGLVLGIVLLLVLRFVSATKFKHFYVKGIIFEGLASVSVLQHY